MVRLSNDTRWRRRAPHGWVTEDEIVTSRCCASEIRGWTGSPLIRGGHRTRVDSVEGRYRPAQTVEHRAHVLEHQPQVGVPRIGWITRQIIVTQARDVVRPGLPADDLQDFRRENLRAEDGGQVV